MEVVSWFPSMPVNSTEYITVLSCSLLCFLRENNEKSYVFQQDNVRVHSSRHSAGWFRSQSIEDFLRPAYSPDMNIIENV